MKNNPEVIGRQRRLIEASRDVAQARGQRQNINLAASYGLSNSSSGNVSSVYNNPVSTQQLNIGISVPLIDWGQGRGKVKMAQSNQELVNIQVQQSQMDFEQNIYLQVMQFNLQNDQVLLAGKADTIGQKRYDVTKQRFLIGKIDVLNLNDALKEKDSAKRGYVDALRNYWNSFYTLRITTLYDFMKNQTLGEEFDKLVQ
jgi:outer membrane protein TolC